MSAIPAKNFEDEFRAWEPHFARYRQLLRQRRKDPRVTQISFQVEKFWTWLRHRRALPTELVPYHFICYARDLRSNRLCVEVETYAPATVSIYLGAAKTWTQHLYKTGILLRDPFQEFGPGYPKKKLYPRSLTTDQVKKILAYPDTTSPLGLRNRTILEILYGSGLRCGEALALTLESLDLGHGVLQLRDTKNGWDRVVPVTRPALDYLIRYLEEARPLLQGPRSGTALWLGRRGHPLGRQALRCLTAGIGETLGFTFTTHSLRHACATHLLEGGANIRAIAELLGHADLGSTAHYAKANVVELQRVHTRTHPRGGIHALHAR